MNNTTKLKTKNCNRHWQKKLQQSHEKVLQYWSLADIERVAIFTIISHRWINKMKIGEKINGELTSGIGPIEGWI